MVRRTVLLLRHAQTEDSRPGGRDHDRRLTAEGDAQERAVGATLARLEFSGSWADLEAPSLVDVRLP